jgi:hypothetical protein
MKSKFGYIKPVYKNMIHEKKFGLYILIYILYTLSYFFRKLAFTEQNFFGVFLWTRPLLLFDYDSLGLAAGDLRWASAVVLETLGQAVNLGSMLRSQFSAIFDNFRRKNWRFSQKTNVMIIFCII